MQTMQAAKRNSQAVWGATPAGTSHAKTEQPGTRAFFESVLARRNTSELPWLYQTVPVSSWCELNVLELGCGAGYDAYEICRQGANYTGVDITPENIERTRKHLALYGFTPTIMQGDAENLQFKDADFDVVYSFGVLHHTPDILKSFHEAHRVLRSGGEFCVAVYHKHSIFYWLSLWLTNHILRRGYRECSFKDRLSRVEFTTSGELPLVNVYSKAEVRGLLERAGFEVASVCVRKLTPEDLPALPLIHRLWRFIPRSMLDQLGRVWGWYVVASAKKH